MPLRVVLLALALLAIPGCVLDSIDIAGRRCPCLAGWVCDATRDRCVRAPQGGDAGVEARIIGDGARLRVDAVLGTPGDAGSAQADAR